MFSSLLICVSVGIASVSATEGWTEDINGAIEQAASQDKDLLLLYTGSDWSPPCKTLEDEVLSDQDFLHEIDQHYVLVILDFPKQKEQPEKTKQRNNEWATRFGVEGFPTVVLTDVSLKPYAFLGYEAGGVQNYLGLIEEKRQLRVTRDEKLAGAAKLAGVEKAKLLDEAIAGMPEELVRVYYAAEVAEIIELDPKDQLGLRSKWNGREESEVRKMILADMLHVSRIEQPSKAIAFIDEVLGEVEFPADQRFQALQIKLSLVRQMDDLDAVNELVDQMLQIEGLSAEARQRLVVKRLYMMVGSGQKPEAQRLLGEALAAAPNSPWLLLAQGTLADADGKYPDAIVSFDQAIKAARSMPDLQVDAISAKADTLYAMKDEATALQTLDNFAEDTRLPAELRAELFLHKSLIMRDMKRVRQARLAENRAIEVTESNRGRAETQKIVEQLRQKYNVN